MNPNGNSIEDVEAMKDEIQDKENARWQQSEALELCKRIEAVCPKYGCHVALTGGLLYKDGARKDCDLLFYRIRQVEEIDKVGLFEALLNECGIGVLSGWGWCHKAIHNMKKMDLFFPEEDGEGESNSPIEP